MRMSSFLQFRGEPNDEDSGNLILKVVAIFVVWGIGLAFILMPFFV